MTSAPGDLRSRIVRRRLYTISRSVVLFVAMVALAPLVVPVAVVVDAVRRVATGRPAMTLRLLAYGFVFLAAELVGLLRLAVSWIGAGFGTNQQRLTAGAWQIQAWWARTLFRAAQRIFALRVDIVGQDIAARGPLLAMFRHASIVDNLLPAVFIGDQLGIHLRWILKRELLSVPSLDVAGNRLPNYFVDRRSEDPRSELRNIRALAENMTEHDGVLIYPEGTRFTEKRRLRVLAEMRAAGDEMLPRAEALRHLMPPRLGGAMALLDSGADVVVGAHTGLEGFTTPGDLWSGALVGRTIVIEFIRIPAAEIPDGRRQRAQWLYDVWARLDDWVDTHTTNRGDR